MTLTQANAKIAEFIQLINETNIGTLCVDNIQSNQHLFTLVLIAGTDIEFTLSIRYTFDILQLETAEDEWEELDETNFMRYLYRELLARIAKGWVTYR